MSKGILSSSCLKVKPSTNMYNYINNNLKNVGNLPGRLGKIVFGDNSRNFSYDSPGDPHCLITEEDIQFINSLNLTRVPSVKRSTNMPSDNHNTNGHFLTLKDLCWLYKHMTKVEKSRVYFHEIFEGSEVLLPENDISPRNEELERRCQRIRDELYNKEYHKMTKKINTRRYPEDSFSYRLKEINKHIVAILQLFISVFAGFAFGFLGIEILTGNLSLGVRLLLGVGCALVVAVAEVYFLLKILHENDAKEEKIKLSAKSSKLG